MRSIHKYEHCKERAAKCLSLAQSMMYAKHYKKYKELAQYYGG